MSDLYIYMWLIFIVGLIAFEAITAQIVALWFIGGALISLILAIFNVPFVFQAIAFVVVSVSASTTETVIVTEVPAAVSASPVKNTYKPALVSTSVLAV